MLWTLRATLCLGVITFAFNAQAQFHCGPRKVIVEQLKQKFKEHSGGMGLSNGVLFEIWSAPETGTFTILTTTPQNISCIMATGKDWSFATSEEEAKAYY